MGTGGSGGEGRRLPSSPKASTPWPVGESFRWPRRGEEGQTLSVLIALPERVLHLGGGSVCECPQPLVPASERSQARGSSGGSLQTGKGGKKALLAAWFLFPCMAQTGGGIHKWQGEETDLGPCPTGKRLVPTRQQPSFPRLCQLPVRVQESRLGVERRVC